MTFEEKIRKLPPEKREVIERLVDILFSFSSLTASS